MPPKSLDVQGRVDQKISGLENTVTRLTSSISNLNSRISELKTRRNLCVPVSRLSAEIIVRVLLEANRCAEDENLFTLRASLKVSGVCRLWRAIALTTPRLWSSIDVTSVHLDGCLELLSRSKSEPLQVRYAPTSHDTNIIKHYDAAAAAVMTEIERIQTMEVVTATPEVLLRFLHINPNVGATSLQVLRLTSQSPGLVLRNDVIGHETPSLRSLILCGATIGPEFPHLPFLTHLLVSASLPRFSGQAMTKLLQCLQNAPNLETVSIDGLFSDIKQHSMIGKLTLPKLSRLNVSSPHISGSKIFDYLQRPTSTSVHFSCPSGEFEAADLASLRCAITHFAVRGAVSIAGVSVTVSNDKQVEVVIDASRPRVPLSPKCFKFRFPFPHPHMVGIVMHLCAALPLAEASSLTLTGLAFEEGLSPEWLNLLRSFEGVELLYVRRCNEDILQGLVGRNDTESLPLPKLREIHFDQCAYDEEDNRRPTANMRSVMQEILCDRTDPDNRVELYWNGALCIPDSETWKAEGGVGSDSVDGGYTLCSADEVGDDEVLEQCITFF